MPRTRLPSLTLHGAMKVATTHEQGQEAADAAFPGVILHAVLDGILRFAHRSPRAGSVKKACQDEKNERKETF